MWLQGISKNHKSVLIINVCIFTIKKKYNRQLGNENSSQYYVNECTLFQIVPDINSSS